MPHSSALVRSQIEAQLALRIPAALSPAARPDTVRHALADTQLNALLHGGVPAGAITEVHGPACSGRTSFACSLASAMTRTGSVAAWVDATDAFDPESAALCGVDLQRLLWVRCGNPSARQDSGIAMSAATGTQPGGSATADLSPRLTEDRSPKPAGNGGGSPHPRAEGRGMPEAIESLLQRRPGYAAIPPRRAHRHIGTPGMPNRDVASLQSTAQKPGTVSHHTAVVSAEASAFPDGRGPANRNSFVASDEIVSTNGRLFGRQMGRGPLPFPHASPYREEQVPTDRQPSRRAAPPQPAERKVSSRPRSNEHGSPSMGTARNAVAADPWTPLDQALRAVDLLLQAGGFSLLVLDLGSVPANAAWRIPLATWFRFRAGCERSQTSLLVISQHPCARASADLTVAMEPGGLQTAGGTVAVGSEFRLQVQQQRRGGTVQPESNLLSFRKPVRSDRSASAGHTWAAASAWSVRA